MQNLFGNLLDKGNPAKKIQKEIESTEFKKQSLITPLQNEINSAQQKIDQTLYQIGKQVYESYMGGRDFGDELTQYFEQIASQKVVVQEKESKIRMFAERYDEELAILKSNIGAPVQGKIQSEAAGAPGAFCSGCGKAYTPGDDLFCENCGQKLG